MIERFTNCDEDYGRRVAEGLKMHAESQEQVAESAGEMAETESTEAGNINLIKDQDEHHGKRGF